MTDTIQPETDAPMAARTTLDINEIQRILPHRYPFLLIVEAIAQAGGALLLTEVEDRDRKLMVFTGIERARFRRPVLPGDQLRIEVDVKSWRMNAVRMEGKAFVGEKRVAEAIVTCQLVERAATKRTEAEP